MAKKATTIILMIVVVLLLASTVYVSIILTSDSESPITTNTRASEIDNELTATEPSPQADPAGGGEPLIPNDPNASNTEPTPADTANGSDLLAYANPTPTGTDTGGTGETGGTELEPAELVTVTETMSPTPSANETVTPTPIDDLPETGLGQPTKAASATATIKVTQAPVQNVGTTLPVAGNLGATVMTVVVAGVTILASFFL